MVAFSHVYIDESGTHDGSPVLTMSGYLFRSEQAKRFGRDWQKELDRLGLPCAHMTDCATGNGDYAGFTVEKRLESEIKLIEHIKRRSVFGFSVSLQPERYAEILAGETEAPSPYTFALMGCLSVVRRWVERTDYTGKIAYFFEAGHRHQKEANGYLNDVVTKNELAAERFAYVAHSFVDKRAAPPLQAADMLAWQTHHYHARWLKGHVEARKDFLALIRPGDVTLNYLDASLLQFRDAYLRGDTKLREKIRAVGPQWPGKAKRVA